MNLLAGIALQSGQKLRVPFRTNELGVFVKQECTRQQQSPKLAIFCIKVTVKVTRLLTLVSFERVSLVDYACHIESPTGQKLDAFKFHSGGIIITIFHYLRIILVCWGAVKVKDVTIGMWYMYRCRGRFCLLLQELRHCWRCLLSTLKLHNNWGNAHFYNNLNRNHLKHNK